MYLPDSFQVVGFRQIETMKIHLTYPMSGVSEEFLKHDMPRLQELFRQVQGVDITSKELPVTALERDDKYDAIHDLDPAAEADILVWVHNGMSLRCLAQALSSVRLGKPVLICVQIDKFFGLDTAKAALRKFGVDHLEPSNRVHFRLYNDLGEIVPCAADICDRSTRSPIRQKVMASAY